MSKRLILELYERVVSLEEKVAGLENCKSNTNNQLTFEPVSEVKGKYRYLSDYLLKSNTAIIELTFSKIEEILQTALPASCRQYREAWANTKSHSIALSWMNVGYRTVNVDMASEKIKFEKERR